jgi:hypothetical protein
LIDPGRSLIAAILLGLQIFDGDGGGEHVVKITELGTFYATLVPGAMCDVPGCGSRTWK